jgi:hypothetical protein
MDLAINAAIDDSGLKREENIAGSGELAFLSREGKTSTIVGSRGGGVLLGRPYWSESSARELTNQLKPVKFWAAYNGQCATLSEIRSTPHLPTHPAGFACDLERYLANPVHESNPLSFEARTGFDVVGRFDVVDLPVLEETKARPAK